MLSSWTDEEKAGHLFLSPLFPVACLRGCCWPDRVSDRTRWDTGDHSICSSRALFHFSFHFTSQSHVLTSSHTALIRLVFAISQSFSVWRSHSCVSYISPNHLGRWVRKGETMKEKWEMDQHGTSSGSGPSGSKRESNKGGAQLSQQLTGTGTNVWPRSGETAHTLTHTHTDTSTWGEDVTVKHGQKTQGNDDTATH